MKSPVLPALPETVNVFLTAACNFRCRHCYATFKDIRASCGAFMPPDLVRSLLERISREPLPPRCPARKITFVGGEPTLCPDLARHVAHAHALGLVTTVITNGTKITPAYLRAFQGTLDWLGFSIDSLDRLTNRQIGRCSPSGDGLSAEDYRQRIRWAKEAGLRLKVNTVVNALNWREDIGDFIVETAPVRWKLLQVTSVKGQNDEGFSSMEINREQFLAFVTRHERVRALGILMVPEQVEAIHGSYVMVSPDGRFFDSAQGVHHYSDVILKVGLREAFAQVAFDAAKFRERGGDYDPFTGASASSDDRKPNRTTP